MSKPRLRKAKRMDRKGMLGSETSPAECRTLSRIPLHATVPQGRSEGGMEGRDGREAGRSARPPAPWEGWGFVLRLTRKH